MHEVNFSPERFCVILKKDLYLTFLPEKFNFNRDRMQIIAQDEQGLRRLWRY